MAECSRKIKIGEGKEEREGILEMIRHPREHNQNSSLGMNRRRRDLSLCPEDTAIGVLVMETGPLPILSSVPPPRISHPEFRIQL